MKTVKLGDIAKISSGGTPSKANSEFWGGEHPWVTAKDLKRPIIHDSIDTLTDAGYTTANIAKQDSLLILVRGMTLHKDVPICIAGRDLAFNQDIKSLSIDPSVDISFLAQYLKSKKNKLLELVDSAGHGTGRLDTELLRSVEILLPPLPEQKAIADLLSTWDKAIEKTEKLIAAKEKSLKHAIGETFSDKATKNKGWKIVQLGEVFAEVTEKVGSKYLVPHSISAGIGFVSHQEKWGKDISGEQYQNYTHLKAGEFAYNKGNSKRYKQGCAYLLKEGEICVPNVFICFKPKNESVVVDFYAHYFIADYHSKELKKFISSGARADGLLNLNKSDFFQIMIPFPTKKEQSELAKMFDTFQMEIEILKSLAGKYKEQKRGLMQKLLTGEWRVKEFT